MLTRRAFTLLELVVTVSIIALAAMLVVPDLRNQGRMRLIAASNILISDIELAQVMTIAQPDQPVCVCFNASGYWLARADNPMVPIPRNETGQPYSVTFGSGRAFAAQGVTLNVENMPNNRLQFNAHGGVNEFTLTPVIGLTCQNLSMTITISPNTGSVTEIPGTL